MVKNLPASVGDVRDAGPIPGLEIPRRRAWQPMPVFWPGESCGQKSLVGHGPRVAKSRTRLKRLSLTSAGKEIPVR